MLVAKSVEFMNFESKLFKYFSRAIDFFEKPIYALLLFTKNTGAANRTAHKSIYNIANEFIGAGNIPTSGINVRNPHSNEKIAAG